jgi:PKD repeat protein
VISSASCTDLACSFDGNGSSDGDGSIVLYEWDFGDGTTSTGATTTHTYTAAASYNVTLTVTDDDSATDTATTTVNPTAPAGDIVMTTGVAGFEFDGGTAATVALFVATDTAQLVPGAEVTGEWTYLDRRARTRTRTVTATTDATGLAAIETRFRRSTPVEFCVVDITKPGYVYVETIPCGGQLNLAAVIPE